MIADKCICEECRFIGKEAEFDKVDDPRGDDTWTVCPRCRTPERVTSACDEPGCDKVASCGFPTAGGYRRTCYAHSEFARRKASTP